MTRERPNLSTACRMIRERPNLSIRRRVVRMMLFKLPARYVDQKQRYEGGQGYVKIYRDIDLDRLMAVKHMKSIADCGILRKELSALRDLSSRHVVQVYDLIFAKNSRAGALI